MAALRLLERLAGLETEYAIRYTPAPDEQGGPGNAAIYEAFVRAIGQRVIVRQGARALDRRQYFVENGGAFYYESLPTAMDGGLLEGATPECRGPGQLLLYQRALDHLLTNALPGVHAELRRQGWRGEVGLLKNCRDAEGNVYGAQENYEVELARGWRLAAWRLGLAALLPGVVATAAIMWPLLLVLLLWALVGVVAFFLGAAFSPRLTAAWRDEAGADGGWSRFEAGMGHAMMYVEIALWWPALSLLGLLLRAVAYAPHRREGLAFLVSRPLLSGAGTVGERSLFGLSEKGPAIRRLMRTTVLPEDRGIVDPGHLMKALLELAQLKPRAYLRLFRRRQRLQLGLSDSNMAQVGEYLKLGATLLVLDMIEGGAGAALPRLEDPLAALHAIVEDPTLQATVRLRGGERVTALQLQRAYHRAAADFVAAQPDPGPEAQRVVRLWGEVLDGLEEEPERLVGRVDWVTKRFLLESVAPHGPWEAQKKVDLRYHELGSGYLITLEARGVAPCLVTPEAAEEACHAAPSETPARLRAELIRAWDRPDVPVTFGWDTVQIGSLWGRQTIRLDQKH